MQRYGAALTGIDVEACQERKIAVFPLRRIVNVAVAEQVFALMITLSKRIVEFDHVVTADQLKAAGYPFRSYDRRYIGGSNYGRIPGLRTLHGSTLGIIGLGEIGREVAVRASAVRDEHPLSSAHSSSAGGRDGARCAPRLAA